jgi:hypothetical protein
MAVLLVPEGVAVGHTSGRSYRWTYGPARLFLSPGRRALNVNVLPPRASDWSVEDTFDRGHAYAIEFHGGSDSVRYTLLRVDPEHYATMHRRADVLPKLVAPPSR